MDMKFRSKSSQLRKRRQKNEFSSREEFDLLKCLALVMTILGVLAWIAGEAFNFGYWHNARFPGPISTISLQSMAFLGFIGPYYNWLWAVVGIGLLGLYVALLSIGRKKKNARPPRWLVSFQEWWKERFTFDKRMGGLGGTLSVLALSFFFLTILPLSLWIFGAERQGSNLFTKQVCQIRAIEKFPTAVKLENGKQISGKILDRSDKFIVIMDIAAIHVLTVADKSQLVDSTSTEHIKCSA